MSDESATSFEVFLDGDGVGLVLHGASIVEDENGGLAPGCKLTPEQAARLAGTLLGCAETIKGEA
jgi:hypothetical protein